MFRPVLVSVMLVAALLPFAVGAAAENDPSTYLVAFDRVPNEKAGDRYAGAQVHQRIDGLDVLVVTTGDPRGFEQRAANDPHVRYVEKDRTDWELFFTPNDHFYDHAAHWGSKRIGAEAAWDVTLGSTAIKVAMVDSGLNKGHEEFAGQSRVLQGKDFRDGDDDPDDTNPCDYHGTHTTGTAGATTNNGKGIAGMSQHSILPVKIFGKGFGGCGTTTTVIVNALKYAGDQGSHLSSNSWGGGGSSSAINDAIEYAHARGTIHVAAAGNSGPCTDCVGQPWKDNPDKTIIVTALKDGDTFASFSSQGPQVDVIAPGEYVAGPTSGTSDYHAYSGTSMAAPHAAGSLALYMAAHGTTDYATVDSTLKSTAEPLGLSSDRQGAGLVRADALVAGGTNGGDTGGGATNGAPTASFTYSCTELTCSFDGTGSTDPDSDPLTYSWAFGDTNTGTGATTSHTYAAGGEYTVTLTVSDGTDTDSSSRVVTVTEPASGGTDPAGIHVGDLDGTVTSGRGGDWSAAITVTVHDIDETVESGATVSFSYAGSKDASGTLSCTSATDGTCTVSVTLPNRESPATFIVTDINDADGPYDAASNQDPDADSDGTSITVMKA